MRNKYFYPIFKLKAKSWIRYWLLKKTEFKGKLSEILEGFSFTLNNTLAMKFNLFEIYGNSIQDGTPSPENEVPIKSAGENGSITEKITNSDESEIQNYTIPVQQPMRSIGDVRDCFVKKSDGWYERHYIKRLIFDGTEEWTVVWADAEAERYGYRCDITNAVYPTNSANMSNIKSNTYITYIQNRIYRPVSEPNAFVKYAVCIRANYSQVLIKNNDYTTVSAFTAYLAQKYANGTPVYVDYLLAEPLDLPCTEEQTNILENLPITYEGQTNIYSEDEVKAFLKIQYWESDTNG